MKLLDLRTEYHQSICREIIRIQTGENEYPNFADGTNNASRQIAWGIVKLLHYTRQNDRIKGQTTGGRFEEITRSFLHNAFENLQHIRPGKWMYSTSMAISEFDQYQHLAKLESMVKQNNDLASALGREYIITPDIVVGRYPLSDAEINSQAGLIDHSDAVATLTPLRQINDQDTIKKVLLHASISCKWTLRSDRGQNARTEALNLIRYRKGHLPHMVAVTAEPLPTRIASLALGTGDLDCVYHFALNELREAIIDAGNEDQKDMLDTLVAGRRLRDISDLPFDLAI